MDKYRTRRREPLRQERQICENGGSNDDGHMRKPRAKTASASQSEFPSSPRDATAAPRHLPIDI